MTAEQIQAIEDFYKATDRLRALNVIRSDRFLGDIAEFLVASKLQLKLTDNKRERGYDGTSDNTKIEVKYNGGSSNTVNCGRPESYDELVVVLGPKSALRDKSLSDPYLFYRIPTSVVALKARHADGVLRFTKGDLKREYLLIEADDLTIE